MTTIVPDPILTAREEAILRSVVYSSLFEYPLTARQLSYSLMGAQLSPTQIRSIYDGSRSLQSVIGLEGELFYRRDCRHHLKERLSRRQTTQTILSKHSRLLRMIACLPFTRLVALSGSAAHLNMTEGADVDLFIVTRAGTVWGTGATILLLSRILGCRHLICFNYLISESQLAVEARDLFTANQIIHLRPLSGRSMLGRLRKANPWVREHYPNSLQPHAAMDALLPGRRCRAIKGVLERVCRLGPSQLLEWFSYCFYRRYLIRSAAQWQTPDAVTLSRSVMKLHTSSHAQDVLGRFQEEWIRVISRLSAASTSAETTDG